MLRIMRSERHATHMVRREIRAGDLWDSKKVGDHNKFLDVVGKIILGGIFHK
jgi:hypothetical protein